MATLQHQFTYEGNASEVPFNKVGLKLEIPAFEYVTIPNNDGRVSSPHRNYIGSHSLKFFQELKSENYSVSIPDQYVIGNNDRSVLNFWDYLKGIPKDLDSLSFQASLSVTHESDILKQDSIDVIYSLATSSTEYKRILDAQIALSRSVSLNPIAAKKVADDIIKYTKENIIFINKNVFDRVAEEFKNIIPDQGDYPLLALISHVTDSTPNKPVLININQAELIEFVKQFHITGTFIPAIIDLIKLNFEDMFNFPISVPEIITIEIKGDIKFLSQTNEIAHKIDLINYDLFVQYTESVTNLTRIVKYRWEKFTNEPIANNTEIFNFREKNDFVLIANQASTVTVKLRLADNTLLQSKTFDAFDSEGLGDIHFVVDLFKLPQPDGTGTGTGTQNPDNTDQQLKGKVLELSGKCSLKGLTVIVQAKEKKTDPLWKIVGSATTDSGGNFRMKYPFGVFEAAQAIVSLTPDSPADIPIYTDPTHTNAKQTISSDFLFLLVKSNCVPEDKTGDSGCDSKPRTPRLPNQEDLINSGEFSQDLAAGTCVNLTTPNRTLSETTYSAIVRTSEPDVANYVLEKNVSVDPADPLNFDKNKVTFILSDGQRVERQPVDLDNPIRWQDAPDAHSNLSFYQAVQVAHGHLLRYKTVWKADGYSLGDLLYSLPLAPGQKKQIVINELKRTLQGTQQQQLIQREGLSASIINDRSIIDSLSGSINESLRGRSSASTGGVSAGLGIGFIAGAVGGLLGVSGGYASSSSTASQDSARTTTQSFSEVLRNSISQSANAYRELNGTIVETVTEGQQFSTTSEVIANHNHCHSLTMLYFEVLRHYAVYQELVQVEECLFVPLLMTNFSTENIYKWRDVLAANLLILPSATYLQPSITLGTGLMHPLIKAFDANERIITKYSNVDYPEGAFDDEPIREVIGEMDVRINFGRPKTRYDRIKSWPLVKEDTHHFWAAVGGLLAGPLGVVVGGIFDSDGNIKIDAQSIIDKYVEINANYASVPPAQSIRVKFFDDLFFDNDATSLRAWTSYANLLGKTDVYSLLREFFENQLVSDWDSIFYDAIAPMLIKKLADNISLSPFNADFTALGKYKGGEQIIRFNFRGTTNLTRKLITQVDLVMNSSQTIASDLTAIIAENISIRYATNHYNGTIFSGYLGNDLSSNDPVTKVTPESADEKRNPRKEDIFIVNALISHLNSNLEYYNKVLWYTLDPNRRYLLLDGFNIEVYNDLIGGIVNKSLASVVKNELIGIAGNSLIFPVAAGVKLDRRNIIIHPPDIEGGNPTLSLSELNLFEHYKPLTPAPPYRISVPTRGVYVEAIQGACDACEKVKVDTSQDWDKFKPDEPTAINPVTVGVPAATEFKPQFKDFATPIVNIQNAPAAPAPGAGLAGISDLLGKAGVFKDITGLDANQQNAIKTYLSNQENARAFAEMAKEMSMQGHNTEHADKIADAIRNSPELSKEEKSQLLKDHFGQMVDGGQSKKAEQEAAQNAKPSLTDAAVKAADQGKGVKAQKIGKDGNTESVDISSSPTGENILAAVKGAIPDLKQDNENACWATAATIMMSWKKGKTLKVEDVLAEAGDAYLQKFNNKESLKSSEKEDFITKLTMVGELPASYTLQKYVDWVKTFGPLWITTDSSNEAGEFSPHAKILVKITGTGTPDGVGTDFTFIDPATGSQNTQHFNDFLKEYEQMVTDNPSDNLFIQIVHFKDEIAGEGKSSAQEAAEITKNWTDLGNLANNSCERRIIDLVKNQNWLDVEYGDRDKPIHHQGFVVGMALMYARIYCRLSKGELFATEMSKVPVLPAITDTQGRHLDALDQFDLEFTTGRTGDPNSAMNGKPGFNITDHSAGKATLRKVFTILFGLGMQESEGDYSAGFNLDTGETASTKKSDVSEAGAFQVSHSIGVADPGNMKNLYTIYTELQDKGSLLGFFKIGKNKRSNPTAHKADNETQQAAAAGINFQKLIYKSPAFSIELAALGIRLRMTHWGPFRKRTIILKKDCYDMFQSIETTMDENSCCTEMGFIRTSYNAISDLETGILATDIAIATDALWIVGKDRLDSKFKLIRYDKATFPLPIGLSSMFDGAKKITIDNNNNPCIIDTNGNIFLTEANVFKQFTNELATDISIESNGTIWIVGRGNEDINGFEIKKFNKSTSSWDVIAGKAIKILIARDDTPWVINKQGELFSFESGTWDKQNTIQKVTDFAIGSDNEIWIIGEINATTQNGGIFKLLNSGDWISYDGSGVAIEIDLTTGIPYVIKDSGLILKMN